MFKAFTTVFLGTLLALPLAAQSPNETYPNETPPAQPQEQQPAQEYNLEANEPDVVEEPVSVNDAEITAEQTTTDDQVDLEQLPQTATPLPLLALLGFAAVGCALGLHQIARR